MIAAGEIAAKVYFASQGEVSDVELVTPHAVDYPYDQNLNLRAGHGTNFLWHSFTIKDDWRQKEFLDFFRERVTYLLKNTDVDKIYLFAPSEDINLVEKVIPQEFQSKISGRYKRNLVNEHPFRLFEEISKENEVLGNSVPISKEARKILKIGITNSKEKRR